MPYVHLLIYIVACKAMPLIIAMPINTLHLVYMWRGLRVPYNEIHLPWPLICDVTRVHKWQYTILSVLHTLTHYELLSKRITQS